MNLPISVCSEDAPEAEVTPEADEEDFAHSHKVVCQEGHTVLLRIQRLQTGQSQSSLIVEGTF